MSSQGALYPFRVSCVISGSLVERSCPESDRTGCPLISPEDQKERILWSSMFPTTSTAECAQRLALSWFSGLDHPAPAWIRELSTPLINTSEEVFQAPLNVRSNCSHGFSADGLGNNNSFDSKEKVAPPLSHWGPPWLGVQGWAASLPRVLAPRQAGSVWPQKPGHRGIGSLASAGKASNFNNNNKIRQLRPRTEHRTSRCIPGALILSVFHSFTHHSSTNSY